MNVKKVTGRIFSMLLLLMLGVFIRVDYVAATDLSGEESSMEKNVSRKISVRDNLLSVDVEYGLGGVAFAGYPVQVKVTITSTEDFTGTLRLIPKDVYNGQVNAMGCDISLAKGSSKTYYLIHESEDNSMNYVLDVVDEKGKKVYSEQDTVYTEWANDTAFVGIVSDDFSGLSYFDGCEVITQNGAINTSLLELNVNSFPENASLLKPIPYMIINNFDTSKFSDEQYAALKEWVMNGGVLFMGLGSNAQNVIQCFEDDFLSGSLGDISKKAVAIDDGIAGTIEGVDVADFTLKNGIPLTGSFAGDIVSCKKIGNGTVIVLGFDLSMEPVASSPYKKMLADTLVTWASSTLGYNNKMMDHYRGSETINVAKSMNDSAKPSTILFGLLFLIYSIVVGPILYAVLKKMNKRESIWIAMPVVALGFTIIVFGASTIYRVRKPLANTFTVLSLADGAKKEMVYANIICPRAKTYSFIVDEAYKDVSVLYTYNDFSFFLGGSGVENGDYSLMVKETNAGKELELKNSASFQERNLRFTKVSDNDMGLLNTDIKSYSDGFEGTLTNNTVFDLTNIVVYMDNKYFILDELKKGESKSFKKEQLEEAGGYDIFYSAYNNHGSAFGRDKKNHQNYLISSAMENTFIDKQQYGYGYVWANIGSYNPEFIKDNPMKQYGGAIIYQNFEANYEDVSQGFCPDINSFVISYDGDLDVTEKYLYGDNASVTYSFESFMGISELINENYTKGDNSNSGAVEQERNYAKVYAFNVETGDYDEIFVTNNSLSGEELKKYLAGDVMILRYQHIDNSPTYLPRISVKGGN